MILLQDLSLWTFFVCFYLVPKIVEHFENGITTDGSESGLLDKGVLGIRIDHHGG